MDSPALASPGSRCAFGSSGLRSGRTAGGKPSGKRGIAACRVAPELRCSGSGKFVPRVAVRKPVLPRLPPRTHPLRRPLRRWTRHSRHRGSGAASQVCTGCAHAGRGRRRMRGNGRAQQLTRENALTGGAHSRPLLCPLPLLLSEILSGHGVHARCGRGCGQARRRHAPVHGLVPSSCKARMRRRHTRTMRVP